MGIRFEVTNHPRFTAEELAIQLADYLQSSADAQEDVRAYQEQIRTERKKIQDHDILIQKVLDFRANPPKKVSRMEPLLQYDLEALQEEVRVAKECIKEWETHIELANEKNKRCQQETMRIQKELSSRKLKK